jgi:membrane associated rhomboid family serine protease
VGTLDSEGRTGRGVIPLRDTIPSKRFPIVNYTLIGLCTGAFLLELAAGPQLQDLITVYGLVPARFMTLQQRLGLFAPDLYVPFLTSIFLHGGWAHYLGNMLYLWIFGDNVEDRLGHLGYLAFYLAGGVFAGFGHLMMSPGSIVPTIGASGAIAAVMGAYVLLYPGARVMTLVVFFFWIEIIAVPAVVYLLFWFVLQLASGTLALATAGPAEGGVAWWAHAGGFIFGFGTVILLGLRRPPSRTRR